MLKNEIIKICTIHANMGGERLDCDQGRLISSKDKETFIALYTTGSFDEHFQVYPLNFQGMQAIEKLGNCYSSGCDSHYASFERLKNFTFEDFNGGAFVNKIYRNPSQNTNIAQVTVGHGFDMVGLYNPMYGFVLQLSRYIKAHLKEA